MVTFNCEVCNDTVPKKNTEKHYYRCPQAYYTCIDCNVTFDDGVGYKKHTQCISEDEKYQKALYKGKKKPQEKKLQQQEPEVSKPKQEKKQEQEARKEKAKPEKVNSQKGKVQKSEEQKALKQKNVLAEKKGASLYKILKSIDDKEEKKNLLKSLVVNENGQLEVKN
ncbi:LAQU0S09e03972g1_1 [Lachancea quebecensis]|uniref:LAQU0S09e03972g1_1 n=1 Tax=Lachancea quebecensis TaxID=1654605 RepID=A0A0N7MLW2_9SACH|nr:LAQU0S09e03972g1_1 [Lachancea quebecensis]